MKCWELWLCFFAVNKSKQGVFILNIDGHEDNFQFEDDENQSDKKGEVVKETDTENSGESK